MRKRLNPDGYPCGKCDFIARSPGQLGGHRNWCFGRMACCPDCGGCGGAFGACFIEGGCSRCGGRGVVLAASLVAVDGEG